MEVDPRAGARGLRGKSVAGIGDINNDGVPDFIVGSPRASQFGGFPTFALVNYECGSARVISGATGATLRAHFGDATGDEFGWSVAALGDINNDGVADYVVGAPQRNNATNTKGYARVYSGATGAQIFSFAGVLADMEFGYAVGGGSDVNGDGRLDIIVGAPGTSNGTIYWYSGSTGFLIGGFSGAAANDRFGTSVAGLGADLNGDGKDDYIVGAPSHANGFGNFAGAAYVLTSITTLTTKYVINGLAASEQVGVCVASAGDVNRDGVVDFMVGCPGYAVPAAGAGRIRVFSGASGAQLNSVAGDAAGDAFGTSLAALGDIDNDGYGDYAAGTWELESSGTVLGNGYIKVISGKSGDLLFQIDGGPNEVLGIGLAAAGMWIRTGSPISWWGPYANGGGTWAGRRT